MLETTKYTTTITAHTRFYSIFYFIFDKLYFPDATVHWIKQFTLTLKHRHSHYKKLNTRSKKEITARCC